MTSNEDIYERLGRMDAKLDAHLPVIAKRLDDHEKRLSSFEALRNRVFGGVMLVGLVIGGTIAKIGVLYEKIRSIT